MAKTEILITKAFDKKIMSVAIITGCSGLIGSEAVKFFHAQGFEVVGIDNNMREYFFGKDGSVEWNTRRLKE